MLAKRQQLPQLLTTDTERFIYCLEAVDDIETEAVTEVQKNLELQLIHGPRLHSTILTLGFWLNLKHQ